MKEIKIFRIGAIVFILIIIIFFSLMYSCSRETKCICSEQRAKLQKKIVVYEHKYDSIFKHPYFTNQFYILDTTASELHNYIVAERKLASTECP